MTMPRLQEEATAARGDGAVSSIVSRLIAKGGFLLDAAALQGLRWLEAAAAELEELVAVHEALGGAASLAPQRSRLELPLQTVKPTLSRAEELLDGVVERHLQMLSLPEETNPFFERSKAGRTFQVVVSGLFHKGRAPTPDMHILKERLGKVEGLIHKAEVQLDGSPPPSLKSSVGQYPPPKVIGRDAECRKIVAALCSTQQEEEDGGGGRPYAVMGIHGAAGSGKTTLAQCIYARARAQEDENRFFGLFMWVPLCRHLTLQEFFSEMIKEATGQTPSFPLLNRDDSDIVDLLRRRLQEELRGKRILLVLDDVRCDGNGSGAELKKILSPLLDVVQAGSKVLLTTRSVDALLVLGAAKSACLPIRDLDDDVFLRLFMHYALGDDGGVDDRDRGILEVIGADIAAKLKRSPLAAKLVGTELRATPQIDFWRSVRDTISTA